MGGAWAALLWDFGVLVGPGGRGCGAGDKTKRIELWAGEDAPEPVWALLSAIEALDRDTESSQY